MTGFLVCCTTQGSHRCGLSASQVWLVGLLGSCSPHPAGPAGEGEARGVEGQVQQLLADAQDPDKLSRMYIGWQAWC